jgi:very-short-patch-repair endonuclease
MTSALENLFAFQLDSAGLTQYVREYQAIPGRKFRFDFCFRKERLLIEINGGTYSKGAHSTGTGIARDYEKGNLAVQHGWKVLQFDTKMVKSGVGLQTTEQLINQSKQEQ